MQIDGQCHCGAIRFEAETDLEKVTICHCTDCQTFGGTAFRVAVWSHRQHLTITGETKAYVKISDAGRKRIQHFCPECGSNLFTHGEGEAAEHWAIRWGSVRQRQDITPTRQLWRRSAPKWLCEMPDIPASETE